MSDLDFDPALNSPVYSNPTNVNPLPPKPTPTSDNMTSYSDSVDSSLKGNTYLDIPIIVSPDKVNVDQNSSQKDFMPPISKPEVETVVTSLRQISVENKDRSGNLIQTLIALNQLDVLAKLIELLMKQNELIDTPQFSELNEAVGNIVKDLSNKFGPSLIFVLDKAQLIANSLNPEMASLIMLRSQLSKLPQEGENLNLVNHPEIVAKLRQLGITFTETGDLKTKREFPIDTQMVKTLVPGSEKVPVSQIQKIIDQLTAKIDNGMALLTVQQPKTNLSMLLMFYPQLSVSFDKLIQPDDLFIRKLFVFDTLNPILNAVNAAKAGPTVKEAIKQLLVTIVLNETLAMLIKEKSSLDQNLQASLIGYLNEHADRLKELTKRLLKQLGKKGSILGKLQKVLLSDIIPGFALLYDVMLEIRESLTLPKVVHVLNQLDKYPSLDIELYGARAFVDVLQRKLTVDKGASAILARILEKVEVLEIDVQELEIVIETLKGMIQFLMNILALAAKGELARPRSQGFQPMMDSA